VPWVLKVPDVETESAPLTVKLRLAVAVWAGVAESVTETVIGNVPLDVGFPDRTPAEVSVSPSRLPVAVHVNGAVPLLTVRVVDGYVAPAETEPAGNDVVATANFAPPLPPEPQPATKRMAMRADIPRI
jgi:hypothetical protein